MCAHVRDRRVWRRPECAGVCVCLFDYIRNAHMALHVCRIYAFLTIETIEMRVEHHFLLPRADRSEVPANAVFCCFFFTFLVSEPRTCVI